MIVKNHNFIVHSDTVEQKTWQCQKCSRLITFLKSGEPRIKQTGEMPANVEDYLDVCEVQ